ALNFIWPITPGEEKKLFRDEVLKPWLGRIIAAMPLCNALIIRDLFDRGQLHCVKKEQVVPDSYDVVVNATGLAGAQTDRLLASMHAGGLLQFNDSGGVVIDTRSHRVSADIPIYANGAIVQGEVFTANSIYSSVHGAIRIAEDLANVFS